RDHDLVLDHQDPQSAVAVHRVGLSHVLGLETAASPRRPIDRSHFAKFRAATADRPLPRAARSMSLERVKSHHASRAKLWRRYAIVKSGARKKPRLGAFGATRAGAFSPDAGGRGDGGCVRQRMNVFLGVRFRWFQKKFLTPLRQGDAGGFAS